MDAESRSAPGSHGLSPLHPRGVRGGVWMVAALVVALFPAQGRANIILDAQGSAWVDGATRHASSVDRRDTRELRAKPQPRDLELERLQREAAACQRKLDKVLTKAKPVLNPDRTRSAQELIRRYGQYVTARDFHDARWRKTGNAHDYRAYTVFAARVKEQRPWIEKIKAALAAKERAYAALREYENSKKQ